MSIGTADLHKTIFAAWNASDLPTLFTGLGGEAPTLQEQTIEPGQSYPYCSLDETPGNVDSRMSGGADAQQIIRTVPLVFHVYAAVVSGDDRTAKGIAAYLAEEVLKVFGGHPTVSPSASLSMDNGTLVVLRYMDDYGIRTGDDEYEWRIEYEAVVDSPLKT